MISVDILDVAIATVTDMITIGPGLLIILHLIYIRLSLIQAHTIVDGDCYHQ